MIISSIFTKYENTKILEYKKQKHKCNSFPGKIDELIIFISSISEKLILKPDFKLKVLFLFIIYHMLIKQKHPFFPRHHQRYYQFTDKL